MANSVYQYEQPRCPDNWNEAERRFYNRLVQVLDDIYAKYGRMDEKLLGRSVIQRIDNSTATALEKMVADIVSAGRIAADSVEATFANVVSLSAKYGDFDFETVKNLVADAMVLEKGQADYIHITNLAATYAQAVNATIGNLVIQSSDGKYYQLDVSADGKVSATETTVTSGEVAAGETGSGKVIVSTHITAETLGTQTLAATEALIGMIDAERINVGALTAREAFIQALTANEAFIKSLVANTAFIKNLGTVNIVGDKTLSMVVGAVDEMERLSSVEVIEGTFAQAERKEGEGIHVFSEVKPKQDLTNGTPYPPGGGKNLWNNSASALGHSATRTETGFSFVRTTSGGSYVYYRHPIKAGETVTFSAKFDNYVMDMYIYEKAIYGTQLAAGKASGRITYTATADYPQATFALTIASAQNDCNVSDIQIEYGSAVTNYAPYANICPVEGWTKLNAALAQKNLLSCAAAEEITNNGITVVSDGKGTYTINGTATGAANCTFALQQPCYIPVGKTIYCHHLNNVANGNIAVGFMDDVKQHSYMSTTTVNRIQQITLLNGVTITRLNFYVAKGQTVENMKVSTMLMLTNEPSEYAPYQGGLYTINFDDAVYGGTVDWAAGEMTATKAAVSLTGNETVTYTANVNNSGYGRFNVQNVMAGIKPATSANLNLICSHYKTDPNPIGGNGVNNVVTGYQSYGHMYIRDDAHTSADAYKAYLAAQYAAGTPVQVCYELAEPLTIQLTPTIIESLDGLNTVFTDADGGRVEFGHSQIDSMLNSIEALEEAQRESALYLKLDAENKVVRIGQTEITSEFDIDAYGAGVVVNGETFSRFEGSRVLIGDMEMRKPANVGGLAFDSIMREVFR